MAIETDELEDEDQDVEDPKKNPQIGKTIPGPLLADKGNVADAPIGKPIQSTAAQPPSDTISSKNILPGVGTPQSPPTTPPEMASATSAPVSSPDTISGMGPLSQPAAPLTPRPQYHGLNRVLDTIGGATKIGSAIEGAGGLGTEGWRVKNADEQAQLESAAKLRGQEATMEEAKARAKLSESQAGQVVITDPLTNHTLTVSAKDAPGIWKEIIGQTGAGQRNANTVAGAANRTAATNETREDVVGEQQTGANARTAATNQTRKDITAEKPEPQTEQAVTDHLTQMGLPDTPGNRDLARNDINTERAAGAAGAKNSAAVAELGLSAQQAYKRMTALAKEDSDPDNYAFLMSFIGLSYEAIKGARLNQPEIVRAAATRTLPDQLQHAYDLYIKNRMLTPEQKQEMLKTAEIISGTYGNNAPNPTKESISSTPNGKSNAHGATSQSGPKKFGDWVKGH